MNRIWHLPKPGSYKSKLFKLTGPIFIENLLIMLLGVVDTFMLSNYAEFLNLDVDSLLGRFADALQARRIELQPASQPRASRPVSSRPIQPEEATAAKPAADGKTGSRVPTAGIPLPRLETPDLMIVGTLNVL